jgi:cytoskeletal protein RodZ
MNKDKKDHLALEDQQARALAEIGEQLRQVRADKGMALEKVAAKTLIPIRLLQAIEDGKLVHLPEPVYVQGLIRRFADALDLNGVAFADRFPTEYDFRPARTRNWRLLPAAQLRPLHLYLLYVFLVIFSVNSLSYSMSQSDSSEKVSETVSQSSSQSSKSQQSSASPVFPKGEATAPQKLSRSLNQNLDRQLAATVAAKAASADGKPVRVGLTIQGRSWIRIVADGKIEFEGTLSEGTHTWEAEQQLTVLAGNAGGVAIALNNGQAKQMGEPGTVKEVTFKADSSPQARSSDRG